MPNQDESSGRAPRVLAYAARGYLVLLVLASLLFIGDGREVRFLPWAMIAACAFVALAWFAFRERGRLVLAAIAVLAAAAGASLGEGEGMDMTIFLLMLIISPIFIGLPLALALPKTKAQR